METKTCLFCGEPKSLEEFSLKDRNTGRRNNICRICEASWAKERYHTKHPLAPTRAFQKNDFHCDTCGELKDPKEFHYARGNRQGICKKCHNIKCNKHRHLQNPSMKYQIVRTEKYLCSKCGEARIADDFYFNKGSDDVTEIRMPCKICVAKNYKNYFELKEKDALKREIDFDLKREIDYDLYAEFKHALGKYKICPKCEQEKHLSEFSEIRQVLLPIHYVSNRYIICFRQIYSTCADCRNRIYVLTDRFVSNAY